MRERDYARLVLVSLHTAGSKNEFAAAGMRIAV
jgi:hypothetical protein